MSKSPSLRRIQADIRELALDPSDRYQAAPLENDMFEWHFTIRGADGTDFEGGVYHGRIMLPPEYPFKPPHIIFLTPSGRFETNTKVCLSFSAYHPELWQPAWGIRLILEALISFLPTPADGAIGALDWTSTERKRLAKKSVNYHCPTCGCKAIDLLPKLKPKTEASEEDESKAKSRFQKEIEKLQQLQSLQHGEEATKKKEEEEKNAKREEKEEYAGANDNLTEDNDPSLTEEAAPSNTATTVDKNDVKESASAKPSEEPTTRSGIELEKLCESDPDKHRRELIQGKLSDIIQGEERREMEKERKERYYSKWEGRRGSFSRIDDPATPAVGEESAEAVEQHTRADEQMGQQPQQPLLAPPMQQNADVMEEEGMLSWMVDPILHGIIVTLAILCFLLLRKLQAMMEELEKLNEVLDG